MRLLKVLSICAATLAITSRPAAGQEFGKFDDSWFWGAKAGASSFSTSSASSGSAATVGLDWMITRTRGGLYVSADESFFNRAVTLTDVNSATGTRQVLINDMKRVGFSGVVFPPPYGRVRGYAGL